MDDAADVWAAADLVTAMAVRVAATLGLADRVGRDGGTATEIARQVDADADALDRLLRHLVTVGLFASEPDGRYVLTARGASLRDGHPSGLRDRLDLEGALGRSEASLVHLLHSVRTGEACFPLEFGHGFWDDVASDPRRRASFDAQMASDVATWAPAVLASYPWGSFDHVVDVGGGDGTLLIALLRAHPRLRGTVIEQPATADTARRSFTAAGLASRADAVAASFFEPMPAGADAYLLCAILHDWDDDSARTILRRCAQAAGSAGRVFVIEKPVREGAGDRTAMDLRLLAFFGGRERTVEQLRALAGEAGLRGVAVHGDGDVAVVEMSTT